MFPPKTGNISDAPASNICPFTVALPGPSLRNDTLRTPVGVTPESVTLREHVEAVMAAGSCMVIVALAAISQLGGQLPLDGLMMLTVTSPSPAHGHWLTSIPNLLTQAETGINPPPQNACCLFYAAPVRRC